MLLFLLVIIFAVNAVVESRTLVRRDGDLKRVARFGDTQFLCNLLCESAEDDAEEDDDCLFDYPFDGTHFCANICNIQDSQVTSRRPTTPTLAASALQTSTLASGATSGRTLDSTMPLPNTSPSTIDKKTETSATSTNPTTSSSLSDQTDSTDTADASQTEKAQDDAEATTASETNETTSGTTTETAETTETTEEATTTEEAYMETLRARLHPFKKELIQLWCEWRALFQEEDSVAMAEKVCPDNASNEMPADLIGLLLNAFETNLAALMFNN